MNLDEWQALAIRNDKLISTLRQLLAEAEAAREQLFKVVIEEPEDSAHEATA